VPYKIPTILADNGARFAKREGSEGYWTIPFDRLCEALGIEHRLAKVNQPWASGQAVNRTIKGATLTRYTLSVARPPLTTSARLLDGL
jgi:hypothetical protein